MTHNLNYHSETLLTSTKDPRSLPSTHRLINMVLQYPEKPRVLEVRTQSILDDIK